MSDAQGRGGGEPGAGSGAVCLGWQFAPARADPGPAPARPELPPCDRLEPGWVAAQARIARAVSRPARAGVAAGAVVAGLSGAAWLAGLLGTAPAGCAALAGAAAAGGGARAVRRHRRALAAALAAERRRVQAGEAARARALAERQREHTAAFRAWQRRRAVADRQPAWFAARLPAGLDRIDIAGGMLASWSALVTTVAAPLLSAGGEISVLDLTEGAAAADLVALAGRSGLPPLVWTLPGDLPRLDLGSGLDAAGLADVLAVAAGAAGGADRAAGSGQPGDGPAGDPADSALLERVLDVLGPEPRIAAVNAALRVLAGIGDPRADRRGGLLTAEQVDAIMRLFGRGAAERPVMERAFALESRLRRLDLLGTGQPPRPLAPVRLRVAALDRRAGVIGNRMLGTYLVAALTQLLRQAAPAEPWAHVICLLGADRLGSDVLDRLADACEATRTGLVLAFRSIPPPVRARLGRGNAAVAFMRLGNGDDARAASELIGTEHRFVISQVTDTVGTSLTDTWSGSYTSTAGTADSVTGSYTAGVTAGGSRGRGRSRQGFGPFGDFNCSASRDSSYSVSESDSVSLTEGINSGTSWGISLSRALGENASLGRTAQRSRELLVEAGELQRLPPSAVIISYPSPAGRAVMLADANPAIGALPGASG